MVRSRSSGHLKHVPKAQCGVLREDMGQNFDPAEIVRPTMLEKKISAWVRHFDPGHCNFAVSQGGDAQSAFVIEVHTEEIGHAVPLGDGNMSVQKTHRMVNEPKISARYLADFMAATELGRRTIVRKCKFQSIARVVQHDEAKATVSKFLREGDGDVVALTDRAKVLRNRMADTEFERDVLDHNADYIDRFAEIFPKLELPAAEFLPPGKASPLELNGVKVTNDIRFRLRRVTKTNKVRIGGAALRYAKSRKLSEEAASWQSSFMLGYLHATNIEPAAEPEPQLCLTIDAAGGVSHPAPSDAISRFNNMKAACATIAEWWPNIQPPKDAVF